MIKTYLLKSKLNKGLIYGAWEESGSWVYLDRDGAKVYIPKELYEIIKARLFKHITSIAR